MLFRSKTCPQGIVTYDCRSCCATLASLQVGQIYSYLTLNGQACGLPILPDGSFFKVNISGEDHLYQIFEDKNFNLGSAAYCHTPPFSGEPVNRLYDVVRVS